MEADFTVGALCGERLHTIRRVAAQLIARRDNRDPHLSPNSFAPVPEIVQLGLCRGEAK